MIMCFHLFFFVFRDPTCMMRGWGGGQYRLLEELVRAEMAFEFISMDELKGGGGAFTLCH